MTAALLPWLELAACVAVIGAAGPALIRNGEIIARRTGVSQSWIGLVLLATATSLPELFTGISAVTVANAPNIAVGDALGSCVFNLILLVLLDELGDRKEPMYRRIDQGHILTAAFGIVLVGAAGAFVLLSRGGFDLQVLHVGGSTPLIIAIYLVAMRAAFAYERRTSRAHAAPPESGISLQAAAWRYAAAAGVVVLAGTWLPFVGKDIAVSMGWRTTFVGTLLIAAATSTPELVVTVSALRLRAVDMAIGNLLGSNLFDVLILAIDDVAYRRGTLLGAVSPVHAITAFAAVIMSGVFVVAMLYQPQTRLRGTVGWVSLALLVVYLFSTYATYLLGD